MLQTTLKPQDFFTYWFLYRNDLTEEGSWPLSRDLHWPKITNTHSITWNMSTVKSQQLSVQTEEVHLLKYVNWTSSWFMKNLE